MRFKNEGYHVSLLYVFVDSPKLAVDRVKMRVKEGGHDVPEPDVKRRYFRSKNNFWETYRYLVDEWQLFYNGEYITIQVACGVQDEYTIANEEAFLIFREGLIDVD